MKKLILTILAFAMVFSLSTTAFAASSLPFTDSDYLKEDFGPQDYKDYVSVSIDKKGVDFPSGTLVIEQESVHMGKRNIDSDSKVANIPDTVVIFGGAAFMGRGLGDDSVDFSKYTNLKYIGNFAFSNNNFTSADLSKTKVVRIGKTSFAGNKKLKTFVAPSTLKRIDDSAFETVRFSNFTLNEGLEYLGYLGLEFNSPVITLPSTLTYISDLNAEKSWITGGSKLTFKVTKGSYAEEWCKSVGATYYYTDSTSPTTQTNPTTPTDPTTPTPSTNFPTMEYTKTLGPVTFSNYVSHQNVTLTDANDNKIDVTWVKISDKGSMRADKDNTEFKYHYSEPWNTTNELDVGRTDNTFGSGHWSLSQRGVAPYATTKSNGTWSKGLTWQFNYNAQYTNQNSFDITVEQGGQKYYYAVTVVTGKPTGTPETTAPTTNSKVIVNGDSVLFDAYTINNNNYFKLRDIAYVVGGSDKQFNVTWDGTKNAINLLSNQAYEYIGGELIAGDGTNKQYTLSTSTIYKDGVSVNLTAYTINGNNYFKLRDLGKAFNFSVTWDSANNAIVIDTTKDHTAD